VAVALDTNAVIGFLDRGDSFHKAVDRRIRELLGQGENLYASVITYAEVLTGAKLGHHSEEVVRGFFGNLITLVMPVELSVADRAAELRAARKALKMPDALILAGADLDPEVDRIICSDEIAQKVRRALDCEVESLKPSR
jgi:predicted nucleic acid-binding protein